MVCLFIIYSGVQKSYNFYIAHMFWEGKFSFERNEWCVFQQGWMKSIKSNHKNIYNVT